MKKTRLFKFLAMGSLFTVAVSAPLVTTLTSCGEPEKKPVVPQTSEVVASSHDIQLTHVFDNESINRLKGISSHTIEMKGSTNYVENTSAMTQNYASEDKGIVLLSDDFEKFSNLFTVDKIGLSTKISKKDGPWHDQHTDSYSWDWSYAGENENANKIFSYSFVMTNLTVKETEKQLEFNLNLKLSSVEKSSVKAAAAPVEVWNKALDGKFTFSNIKA